jgi:protein TonB
MILMTWVALAIVAFARCGNSDEAPPREARRAPNALTQVLSGAPDELPAMANAQPPFRYPVALYAQRVQGNVTLRLYVDSTGVVVSDSTQLAESSGHVALDSAALLGARDLRFTPARRRGSAIAVSLLYPVYFRHPEAKPLPEDSLLTPR